MAVKGQRRQLVERRSKRQGLLPHEQDAVLAVQGGRCPLCLRPFTDATPYVVDHDHDLAATHGHNPGVGCRRCVRGLICQSCNTLLGKVERSGFLARMLGYIPNRRGA